jgi:hypothetical protein
VRFKKLVTYDLALILGIFLLIPAVTISINAWTDGTAYYGSDESSGDGWPGRYKVGNENDYSFYMRWGSDYLGGGIWRYYIPGGREDAYGAEDYLDLYFYSDSLAPNSNGNYKVKFSWYAYGGLGGNPQNPSYTNVKIAVQRLDGTRTWTTIASANDNIVDKADGDPDYLYGDNIQLTTGSFYAYTYRSYRLQVYLSFHIKGDSWFGEETNDFYTAPCQAGLGGCGSVEELTSIVAEFESA